MDRRRFISAWASVLAAAPFDAPAQQPEKLYRVGLLTLGTDPARSGFWQQFLGKADRLPDLVADLVQAKVDVIVVTSTPETLAAKRATSTIPIVMTVAPDPVGGGLVASLARPGGNVTGLTSVVPGISEKYVELLREAVPSASRFAVISNTGGPFPEIRRELEGAARQFGVAMSFTGIQGPDDIDPALTRAKNDGAGGIIAPLGSVSYRYRAQLVQLALKHWLPGIYWHRDFVEAGGLMSYGTIEGPLSDTLVCVRLWPV